MEEREWCLGNHDVRHFGNAHCSNDFLARKARPRDVSNWTLGLQSHNGNQFARHFDLLPILLVQQNSNSCRPRTAHCKDLVVSMVQTRRHPSEEHRAILYLTVSVWFKKIPDIVSAFRGLSVPSNWALFSFELCCIPGLPRIAGLV